LSNLYKTTRKNNEFQFTNDAGDVYYVYMSQYYLDHPASVDDDDMVKINHIGFACKRKVEGEKYPFDSKSQNTIKDCFLTLINERHDDAFIYLCDDKDSRGRNRRITFGKWIRDEDPAKQFYIHNEQVTHTIEDKPMHLYMTLIVREDNPLKSLFREAFDFTLDKHYR
jgi:hypothetical protein